MTDSMFPERPSLPPLAPRRLERIVPRRPLASIREVLSISIHEIVNDRACKGAVIDLYRVTRAIDNEAWLRRIELGWEQDAWIAAHL